MIRSVLGWSMAAAVLACAVLAAQKPRRSDVVTDGLTGEESAIAALSADIVSIVRGGVWKADGRTGFYRLVVVSGGYEHVTSSLYVQWVQESQDSSTPSRVVHTKNAFGGSLYSLGVHTLSLVDGKWQATVDGSQASRRGRWVLTLGAPGDVQVREVPGG